MTMKAETMAKFGNMSMAAREVSIRLAEIASAFMDQNPVQPFFGAKLLEAAATCAMVADKATDYVNKENKQDEMREIMSELGGLVGKLGGSKDATESPEQPNSSSANSDGNCATCNDAECPAHPQHKAN